MKEFDYVITEPAGLHSRPAASLARFVGGLGSAVKVAKAGVDKTADAKSMLAVMTLAIKTGDTAHFTVEGDTEEQDAQSLSEYCKKEL